MSTSAIQIQNLTVRYRSRLAVDGISLDVPAGSVYALLGRNGAGKSSLVRCLLGQQRPTSGSVAILDQDVWKHRVALMDRTGVVAEDADAPPAMRVSQVGDFCSRLYSHWSGDAYEARLRRFGIARDVRFGDLSKGQKKQVALASALAMSPEVLVLDDPTLGLDVVARKSLFDEVIGELADRGITVFLTTHDLAGIEGIADRVAIMKEGHLVLDEELEVMKSRFRRIRMTTSLVALDAALGASAVRRWGNGTETIVTRFDEQLFERFRDTSHIAQAEVTSMSLEEIFIAVAGENEGPGKGAES